MIQCTLFVRGFCQPEPFPPLTSFFVSTVQMLRYVLLFYFLGIVWCKGYHLYKHREQIPVYVHSVNSPATHIPLQYYHNFQFCIPEEIQSKSRYIGDIILGDVLDNTPHTVSLLYMQRRVDFHFVDLCKCF